VTLPRLIHPIPIELETLSKSTTIYDEDAREPVQAAARTATKTVVGQVKWAQEYALDMAKGGPQEGSLGYILFRYVDLQAQGIELKQNDRITKIGHLETDVYVKSLEPVGHYPDQVGASMVKAHFMDRQPSRQRRGGYSG
jgi:hypothetical protein